MLMMNSHCGINVYYINFVGALCDPPEGSVAQIAIILIYWIWKFLIWQYVVDKFHLMSVTFRTDINWFGVVSCVAENINELCATFLVMFGRVLWHIFVSYECLKCK
jgi:hypothetical protein